MNLKIMNKVAMGASIKAKAKEATAAKVNTGKETITTLPIGKASRGAMGHKPTLVIRNPERKAGILLLVGVNLQIHS